MTTADEYRAAVRRGARFVAPHSVTYVRRTEGDGARFGFIVSKAVGVAVTRNRVRRRLKAICYALQPSVVPGLQIVIRALPEAAAQPFDVLKHEVVRSLTKAKALSDSGPRVSGLPAVAYPAAPASSIVPVSPIAPVSSIASVSS